MSLLTLIMLLSGWLSLALADGGGETVGPFIKYDNDTVLDSRTHLLWMRQDFRNIEGHLPRNMGEALAWVRKMNTLRYAGYGDWRVPTLEEFQDIYDKRRLGRSYRNHRVGYPEVFENGGGEYYWVFEAEKTDHWLGMHPHIISFTQMPYDLENAQFGEDDPGNSIRLVRTVLPDTQPVLPARPKAVTSQRIAVLKSHDLSPFNLAANGFLTACQQYTVTTDTFDLRGGSSNIQDMIERIVSRHYDLVLAIGPLAAKIASAEIDDMPVVVVMAPRIQQNGWMGKNVAGIALHISAQTQFKAYKKLLPGLRTIGVIYNPEHTGPFVARAARVATQMGLELLATPVTSPKAVPDALRGMLGKIDALWMIPDETVVTLESFKFFTLTTVAQRLPFLVMAEVFAEVGALAGVSSDYTDIGRQACQLAKKIIRGQLRPAEVGVEAPEKANLTLNLKVAEQLGLVFPKSLVESADKVIR
jgi:putative ABC transport system substrate-binding protein